MILSERNVSIERIMGLQFHSVPAQQRQQQIKYMLNFRYFGQLHDKLLEIQAKIVYYDLCEL